MMILYLLRKLHLDLISFLECWVINAKMILVYSLLYSIYVCVYTGIPVHAYMHTCIQLNLVRLANVNIYIKDIEIWI